MPTRNDGGGAGGDAVNLETKNVYLEFMVPDTPVKATIGLQGVTLHKGWFVSDDFAGCPFRHELRPCQHHRLLGRPSRSGGRR